jgi:hypothetical protein
MRLARQVITLAASLLLLAVTVSAALASDSLVVLIAVDDRDPVSVPRADPVHEAISQAIAGQLRGLGYRAVMWHEDKSGDASTRVAGTGPDAMLTAVRRRPDPPDLLVLASVNAEARVGTHVRTLLSRLSAVVIVVGSGERFGDRVAFRSAPRYVSKDCLAACLIEGMREQVDATLPEFSQAVARVTDGGVGVRTWEIRLQDFGGAGSEVAAIEEYLKVFPGFETQVTSLRTENETSILYRSTAGRAAIRDNIERMLRYLAGDIEAKVASGGFQLRQVAGQSDR